MSTVGSGPVWRAGRATFVREFRESSRNWASSALAVRAVQLLAGFAVFALAEHHRVWTSLLLLVGLAVAVISPARNGPALVLIAALVGWLLPDLHHAPPLVRVLPFTLALFVLHSASALAATVPLSCQLHPAAWRHWLARCGRTLAISAPLIGGVYLVGAITDGVTSDALQFAGLVGVLMVIVVATTWFARRLSRGA